VPIVFFVLALLIGIARIAGPASQLYPVEGDSAKYNQIAQGFATLYSHPIDALGLWFSHHATPADLHRYNFDSWVLQHAPAYTAYLGIGYLITGNAVASGRFLTVLLFAAGAVFIYRIAREFFGKWPAILAGSLFILWPANWSYAPAILTEIPVTTAALGASYVLMRTARSGSKRAWILGGIALGVLVLTKTTLRYVAVPWILVEALVDRRAGRKIVLRRAGFRCAGWAGMWILWVIFLWGFNLSPNPLGQSGDDWLWIYRGDHVPDRGWELVGLGDAYSPELIAAGQETQNVPEDRQKREMYKKAFLETLRRDPRGMAALVLAKAGIFWRFPAVKTYQSAGPISLPPPARVQPALAVAALLGVVLCIGANGRRCIPAVFPIYLMMLHSATHLVSRYNAPAVPFAMLYGAGSLGIVVPAARREIVHLRAGLRVIAGRLRPLSAPLAFAIAGVILCAVLLRFRGGIASLGPWVAGAGLLPLLSRAMGAGALGRIRAVAFAVPLCLISSGSVASDPLPGQGRIHLSRPGDGVRVKLHLPPGVKPESFTAAEVLLDLLPSERGAMTLSIRLSGREIACFAGRPPSGPDCFLLDAQVHGAEDRYRRVLRSLDRHLNEFVRRHRGMETAGYDYYRQWYRVPCDPAVAFASSDPVLEIVLVDTRGGSCDVFYDQGAPATGDSGGRTIEMPAFFENPYELSSYRFDALASNRLEADARLARPIPVHSERAGASRFDASGNTKPIRGEPRIRLRGRVPGGYGFVDRPGRDPQPEWVSDPSKAIRMLAPPEIRMMQADRDRYFDGFITF